jgi:hypothetical protein
MKLFTYKKAFNKHSVMRLKKNEVLGAEYYLVEVEGKVNTSFKYEDRAEAYEMFNDLCADMYMTCVDESVTNIQN